MKFSLKLFTLAFILLLFGVFSETTEANASSKIYREYNLPEDRTKFPIKLTNGLTISSKVIGDKRVPVVLKGNKQIWQGSPRTKNNTVRFTVTSAGDTYLYFKSKYYARDTTKLVGIRPNGDLFLDSTIEYSDYHMYLDFISPSLLEIRFHHSKRIGDDFISHYQLYKNGNINQVPYVDNQFFKLLKAGQLKWVPGKIGEPFSTFRSKVDNLPPISKGFGEHIMVWYGNWKGSYGFRYAGTYNIKNNQKVRLISKTFVIANRQQIGPMLSKHLGKPIEVHLDTAGGIFIYRFGKYLLYVMYYADGTASFNLWDYATYRQYLSG